MTAKAREGYFIRWKRTQVNENGFTSCITRIRLFYNEKVEKWMLFFDKITMNRGDKHGYAGEHEYNN